MFYTNVCKIVHRTIVITRLCTIVRVCGIYTVVYKFQCIDGFCRHTHMICIYYNSVCVYKIVMVQWYNTGTCTVGLLPIYERYMDDTSYKYKIIPIGVFYIYVLMG